LEVKQRIGTDEEQGQARLLLPLLTLSLPLTLPSLPPSLPLSGLTIGLLSVDALALEIKQRVGTEEEQGQARRLLPLLAHRHLLLVTLLLFNAASAEALPLFLDELVPSYAAVVVSVTAVLFFGVSKPFLPPFLLSICRW